MYSDSMTIKTWPIMAACVCMTIALTVKACAGSEPREPITYERVREALRVDVRPIPNYQEKLRNAQRTD